MLLAMRPGITGSWAVHGRSEVGYPDRVKLELDYVRNWSVLGDLQILVRTPLTVFTQRGAVSSGDLPTLRHEQPVRIGGLVMGYGARLAYGCNIGAYFSGIVSGSLHGWLWLVVAFVGNVVGTRLRPLFGLEVERVKPTAC